MTRKISDLEIEQKIVAKSFLLGFIFLAFGKTLLEGFRFYTNYISTSSNLDLMGFATSATGITITIFFIQMLETSRLRFKRYYSIAILFLFTLGFIEIILIFIQPFFAKNNILPSMDFDSISNLVLWILEFSTALIIIHDSIKYNDKTFKFIGFFILLSPLLNLLTDFYNPFHSKSEMNLIFHVTSFIAPGIIGYLGLFKNQENNNLIYKGI